MVKPVLGRGLGALLGGVPTAPKPPATSEASPPEHGVKQIALKLIEPCQFQPRKEFSQESLRELADSIKQQGVVQPLIVRPKGTSFELIAGERRWRAAQMLGLSEIPAIVREADDRTVLELALIENLQRENLNPLEEALGFAQLIEQFNLTQEDVANRVSKSRAAVANALRLLKLPGSVQEDIRSGRLSVGHAKVILGLGDADTQSRAAAEVVQGSLNVRQTEDLVAQWQTSPKISTEVKQSTPSPSRDPHITDLEHRLKQRLGTKVLLRYRGGKGAIEVRFFSDAELERLLQIVGVEVE